MPTKLLTMLALLTFSSALIYWYTLRKPGRSHAGPLPTLNEDEREMAVTLRSHVEAIASRPHNTDFPEELEKSARNIEEILASLGYTPQAQKFVAAGVEVRNIEVVIEPASAAATALEDVSTLVIGAHYDSAGNAPGANDNGSGVAALLELARLMKSHSMNKTKLRIVFFVNEEPPHFKTDTMGSLVYARSLAATGEKVRAMLCLETLGAYSDKPGSQKYPLPLSFLLPNTANFIAVVGTLGVRSLVAEVTRRFRESVAFPSIGGVAPGVIPGITWSDHWSFGKFGISAVMITDTVSL
jgi:Zn-dependent M28 family amino/carboxypeptidase